MIFVDINSLNFLFLYVYSSLSMRYYFNQITLIVFSFGMIKSIIPHFPPIKGCYLFLSRIECSRQIFCFFPESIQHREVRNLSIYFELLIVEDLKYFIC